LQTTGTDGSEKASGRRHAEGHEAVMASSASYEHERRLVQYQCSTVDFYCLSACLTTANLLDWLDSETDEQSDWIYNDTRSLSLSSNTKVYRVGQIKWHHFTFLLV